MEEQHKISFLFVSALLLAALICPVSAESVTLSFQDIGIATQDIDVFDASGQHLCTTNTSSVLSLNLTDSSRYTLQLKPQATTVDPTNLADSVISWLTQNALIVTLLLFRLLVVFGGGGRRR